MNDVMKAINTLLDVINEKKEKIKRLEFEKEHLEDRLHNQKLETERLRRLVEENAKD